MFGTRKEILKMKALILNVVSYAINNLLVRVMCFRWDFWLEKVATICEWTIPRMSIITTGVMISKTGTSWKKKKKVVYFPEENNLSSFIKIKR